MPRRCNYPGCNNRQKFNETKNPEIKYHQIPFAYNSMAAELFNIATVPPYKIRFCCIHLQKGIVIGSRGLKEYLDKGLTLRDIIIPPPPGEMNANLEDISAIANPDTSDTQQSKRPRVENASENEPSAEKPRRSIRITSSQTQPEATNELAQLRKQMEDASKKIKQLETDLERSRVEASTKAQPDSLLSSTIDELIFDQSDDCDVNKILEDLAKVGTKLKGKNKLSREKLTSQLKQYLQELQDVDAKKADLKETNAELQKKIESNQLQIDQLDERTEAVQAKLTQVQVKLRSQEEEWKKSFILVKLLEEMKKAENDESQEASLNLIQQDETRRLSNESPDNEYLDITLDDSKRIPLKKRRIQAEDTSPSCKTSPVQQDDIEALNEL